MFASKIRLPNLPSDRLHSSNRACPLPQYSTGLGCPLQMSYSPANHNSVSLHGRKDMTASAPNPDHILQTGLAFWASKTLLSAVEMEVFTELAKGPEDLDSLTGRLGLHRRSSRDFLDTLVALGFLERQDGKYSNTPATDVFLDKHKPSYIGGML